jgi:hypothetical protein
MSDVIPEGVKVVETKAATEDPGAVVSHGVVARGKRYTSLITAASSSAPPQLAKVINMIAPCLGCFISAMQAMVPLIVLVTQKLYAIYNYLPTDLLEMIIGLTFCFCGGLYPTLFAAFEAARLSGWEQTADSCSALIGEVTNIFAQNEIDDKKDEDGDGIADVLDLTPS